MKPSKLIYGKPQLLLRIYCKAEFVFRSERKIPHGDWLLNGPIFHDNGQLQYAFYSEQVSFGGKIF